MWNRSTGILDGPPSGSEVNIVHNEARAAEIDCGGGNIKIDLCLETYCG